MNITREYIEQLNNIEPYFFNFGLNTKNFENLKFEDEPVEVFLNLE